MSGHQTATLEDTVYFWFAANDTSGSGDDGASPLFDVREAGAAASAAPLLSGTPALLSNAAYPAGCYEIAVAATDGNGFAANDTFAVFCTLAVDSQNPSGFVGSCTLTPLAKAAGVLLAAGAITNASLAGNMEIVFETDFATNYNTTRDAWVTNGTDFIGTGWNLGKTGYSVSETGLDAVLVDGTFLTAVEDQIWDAVLTGASHNDSTSAGRRLRQLDAGFIVTEGTADAGSTSTTINLETGVADATTDNIYAGDRCVITAGTGAGEHGLILSYSSSDQIATMSKAWVITPDDTSEYILLPADVDVELWNDTTVTGDGDWAELQTDVDALITQIGTAGAGLTDLGAMSDAMKAEILVEINAALNASISELGVAAPTATPTLRTGLMLLYMALRNKHEVTATRNRIFNNAGTQITESVISDDATTFTDNEFG